MYNFNGVRLDCREILEISQHIQASQTERFRIDVWSTVSAMNQVKSNKGNRIAHETVWIIISDFLQLTYWVWYRNDSVREASTTGTPLQWCSQNEAEEAMPPPQPTGRRYFTSYPVVIDQKESCDIKMIFVQNSENWTLTTSVTGPSRTKFLAGPLPHYGDL